VQLHGFPMACQRYDFNRAKAGIKGDRRIPPLRYGSFMAAKGAV